MKTLAKLAKLRTTLPVLNTILVQDGKATSTDLDMTITAPSDLAPGLYKSEGFAEGLAIVSDIPVEDYPSLVMNVSGDVKTSLVMPVETLDWLLSAMSTEETRYYLCGINFAENRAAATDGQRLNVLNGIETGDSNLICPAMAVKYAIALAKEHKVKEITVTLHEKHVSFTVKDTVICTKVIDGKFPSIDRIIPKTHAHELQWDNQVITSCLKEIKIRAKAEGKKTPIVKLNGKLEAYGQSHELAVKFPFEIGFNAEYLADLMPGTMTIQGDACSPVKVVNGNRVSVLMPVRV